MNFNRLERAKEWANLYKLDGLNDLTYKLISKDTLPLYTRILVDFDGPKRAEDIWTYMEADIQNIKNKNKTNSAF